ncbi:hypothetical protein BX666DRAFT_1951912 [Dichotomocladium elegans]|nr:hypothetical protein BX666DRAFT_1951912 [Dichotomocladium elegans]
MATRDLRTFEYHCTTDGTCHCDWRVTLQDCVEQKAMTDVYIANIAFSSLVAIIGVGLLVHRIGFKGHRLFEFGSGKGCLRPKPIDCLLFLLTIFNCLRLITSVILVTDVAKDMTSRMIVFELPWQFGYGAFVLYMVGIAQTLADSHKAISSGWLPSSGTVDVIGCTFFFAPFIVNNIIAITSGALARTNVAVAETLVRVLYVVWFIHCFSLGVAVLYAGVRLIRILNDHLIKIQPSGPRYDSIKTGIFKIRSVVIITLICLFGFAIFLLMYGALRDAIMINPPGSIFLGVMWNFLGSLSTLFVEIAVLFNPKIGNASIGGLKTSSAGAGGKSTLCHDETQMSSFAGPSGFDTSFQGSINSHGYEDLKAQQMQYQQVFQKHNNRHNTNTSAFGTKHSYNGASSSEKIAVTSAPARNPIPASWQQSQQQSDEDDLSSQIHLMNEK